MKGQKLSQMFHYFTSNNDSEVLDSGDPSLSPRPSLYLSCTLTGNRAQTLHVEASVLLLSDSKATWTTRPTREQVHHLEERRQQILYNEREGFNSSWIKNQIWYLLIVDFQHTEEDLSEEHTHSEESTTTQILNVPSYLTLSGILVFSNGLKQSIAEFRNQSFVRPVSHHGVTLP